MLNRLSAAFKAFRSPVEKAIVTPTGINDLPGPWSAFTDFQTGTRTVRGVSELTAHSAVFACVSALAQDVARLPFEHWMSLPQGGRTRQDVSTLSRLLRKPNRYQSRVDFFAALVRSVLLRGNAYAVVTRDGRNGISELHPIHPDHVTVAIDDETGDVFYRFGPQPLIGLREASVFPSRDVLHVRAVTLEHPLVGVTPLHAAALSAASGLAMSEQQQKFFEQMARPSLLVSFEKGLQGDTLTRYQDAWTKAHSGANNAGKTAFLGDGAKVTPLTMSAVDAQLIEQLRFTVEDVARAFRVPLFMLGINEAGPQGGNEARMSAYRSGGLGFYVAAIEAALDDLFQIGGTEWIAVDYSELLRTDFATRMQGLATAVQAGVMTPNEARKVEWLGSVDGGDECFVQRQNLPLSLITRLAVEELNNSRRQQEAHNPDATQAEEAAKKQIVFKHLGKFDPEHTYREGEACAWRSCSWIATRDVNSEPPGDGWNLLCKGEGR